MSSSWYQLIPGHQQTFKQKIIALYRDDKLRLDGPGGVREFMKEHHNFKKSVSTYRRQFHKWDIRKNNYPTTKNTPSQNPVDSEYATPSHSGSSATPSSVDAASPFRRHSAQSLLNPSLQNPSSPNDTSSSSQPNTEVPGILPVHHLIDENVAGQRTEDDLWSASSYPPEQLLHPPAPTSPRAGGNVNHRLYRPPHAPPSQCSRSGTTHEILSDLGLQTCHHCGATKLHHLASISHLTDPALFEEVIKSRSLSINEPDNEGNLCIHFAVGAGASLDKLVILQRAGAYVAQANNHGQTLLHILDPHLYGPMMPEILAFALRQGLSFSQRDHDGKTPLHHLLGRTITLAHVHDLMPFLQIAGRSLTFLDRDGNTPLDVVKGNWQRMDQGVHLPRIEAMFKACNVPLAFRSSSGNWSKVLAPMPDVSKLAIISSSNLLNIINRSHQEPYFQDRFGQNVLHALAAFSFRANHPISCSMTPWELLKCLQHRLGNSANVGVDVNQFNSDGLTPLHCFLTATFDLSQDIPWLVPECVEALLQSGADPELRDRDGNTALHLACSRGRFVCAGKIIGNLFSRCGERRYIHCLSAVNDRGKTAVEHAEASMSSETSEANARRKQCINFVRAAMEDPMGLHMKRNTS